ncbi:TPA: hypothetical protein DEB72_00585 [Patescibacteria group bacterium]|nr:hypothetical protein [Patescibacteria group bacterium]
MYLSIHGTAALVVAQSAPNPWLAFIYSLFLHLLLDIIPHGDEFLIKGFAPKKKLRRLLGATIIDGLILIFLLATYFISTSPTNITNIGWALAGALLPDFLEAIYLTTDIPFLKPWHKFHDRLHDFFKHHLLWTQGVLVQVMVLTALWLWLI